MDQWNIRTLNALLCGSVQLFEDHNSDLFKLVQQYINQTGRFEWVFMKTIFICVYIYIYTRFWVAYFVINAWIYIYYVKWVCFFLFFCVFSPLFPPSFSTFCTSLAEIYLYFIITLSTQRFFLSLSLFLSPYLPCYFFLLFCSFCFISPNVKRKYWISTSYV